MARMSKLEIIFGSNMPLKMWYFLLETWVSRKNSYEKLCKCIVYTSDVSYVMEAIAFKNAKVRFILNQICPWKCEMFYLRHECQWKNSYKKNI